MVSGSKIGYIDFTITSNELYGICIFSTVNTNYNCGIWVGIEYNCCIVTVYNVCNGNVNPCLCYINPEGCWVFRSVVIFITGIYCGYIVVSSGKTVNFPFIYYEVIVIMLTAVSRNHIGMVPYTIINLKCNVSCKGIVTPRLDFSCYIDFTSWRSVVSKFQICWSPNMQYSCSDCILF